MKKWVGGGPGAQALGPGSGPWAFVGSLGLNGASPGRAAPWAVEISTLGSNGQRAP